MQNALKEHLDCKNSRINRDEQDFNTFKAINKIHRHVKKFTQRSLIDRNSKKLLGLEFMSSHSLKSIKYCQTYAQNYYAP